MAMNKIIYTLIFIIVTIFNYSIVYSIPLSSNLDDYIFQLYDLDNGLNDLFVTSIISDENHGFYVGTWKGILKFDGMVFSKLEMVDNLGIEPSNISCLCFDEKTKTLWIGSIFNKNHGLFKYQNGQFTRYTTIDGLPNNNITSICLGDGKVFIGTWGGGIAIYDGTKFNVLNTQNGFFDDFITSVDFNLNDKSLWVSSKYNGVCVLKDDKLTVLDDHTSSLVNNYVHKLAIDKFENVIYFCTSGGLSKYDGKNWENIITSSNSISSNFVKDVFIFRKNLNEKPIVYCITSNDISILSELKVYNLLIKEKYGMNFFVNSICVDDGVIYLGTNKGVCKIARRN